VFDRHVRSSRQPPLAAERHRVEDSKKHVARGCGFTPQHGSNWEQADPDVFQYRHSLGATGRALM